MLRPFFSYYGGKWRDAGNYPSPQTGRIIEPFAGSAGYSLRHSQKDVVLCELDEKVFGVWNYLINEATPERIRELPDVPEKEVNTYPSQLRPT